MAAIVSAFAALLTGISVFSSDGIIVGAISSVLKGLFGYGFWVCAPVLLLVAVIQGFHHGRPVAFKTTSALLMPLLLGALLDLLFSTVIVENLKGVGAVLGGLYAGGKAMTCGGVFGGLLAFGMGWGWVLAAVLDCCLDLVCPLRAVFLVVVFLFLVCAITKLSLPLSEYHGKNYR